MQTLYQFQEQKKMDVVTGQPQLILATRLTGTLLHQTLSNSAVINQFGDQEYGIALAMTELDDDQVAVVRLLNFHGISTIAWLLHPPDEGGGFNLQNYPQSVERYREFHTWATQHQLHFDAVALHIELPAEEMAQFRHMRWRDIAHRLWLAHDNVLYPAARTAYTDLLAEIRHDGYETHVFQTPLMVDDRRAGTNLLQRALDVVDLPADLDVLICSSTLPLTNATSNLRSALIASYGPDADSIGIGYADGSMNGMHSTVHGAQSSWDALERDMLLAAQYTDTIYIFSLESCLEHGMFPRIADIDWGSVPSAPVKQRVTLELYRSLFLALLLLARHSRQLLAWLGWVIALVLLIRRYTQRHEKREKRRQNV